MAATRCRAISSRDRPLLTSAAECSETDESWRSPARAARRKTALSPSACRLELGLDREQARRGLAQHRRPLRVGETRRLEDVVDRSFHPWKRIVRSHDDLAGADLRGQMAQPFGREDDRIVVELAQVIGREFIK